MKWVRRTDVRGGGLVLVCRFLIGAVFFVALSFISTKNVSAWSYSECLRLSGGRQNIASVQWACAQQTVETSVNICSLWVGGNNSVDPTIYVDSAVGVVTIYYYGMCTLAENTTSDIWIYNDNGSIDASRNLRRGIWAYPNSISTHLDVGKFVNGATRTAGEGGDVYTRNIQVCRKNEYAYSCDSYTGACSCMDETVRVVVKKQFHGKSMVSSSNDVWSNTNGASVGANNTFTQENGKVTYYIDNCDPVNGCTAKFWHYLRRQGKTGSTTYTIKRTSNYSSISSGVVVNNATETFASGEIVKVREETYENKLKPGQTVCETMTFSTNGINNEKSLTVCASALGDVVPPPGPEPEPYEPSEDKSYLNIKVKNQNVEKYASFQSTVYAKPGDMLTYQSVYNPLLQYTYNLIPDRLRIDGSTAFPSLGVNLEKLGDLYNLNRGSINMSLMNWRNAYSVNSENFSNNIFNQNYSYNVGNTESRTNSNEHIVSASEAGRSLNEIAWTNSNEENKTTPSGVSFVKQNIGGTYYSVAQVATSQIKKTASAKVPYNYQTAISIDSSSETVGAGENGTINVSVDVLTKTNNETTNGSETEAYATKMPGASVRLIVYAPGAGTTRDGDSNFAMGASGLCGRYVSASICGEKTVVDDRTFNADGDMNGKTGEGVKNAQFNVPDIDAGSEICVAAAVYPANSGSDTNLDVKGNDRWNISNSKCFKVAKKPSLQIWGSGIYSMKDLKTPTSKKNNIYGYVNYDASSNNQFYIFGSWAEYEVIALGTVTGFSSGASTGFANNNGGALWPSYNYDNTYNTGLLATYGPGGSLEASVNYCLRSVLTFANDDCSRGVAGMLGGSKSEDSNDDKANMIEKLRAAREGSRVVFEKKTGDYVINENLIAEGGTTRVIDAEGVDVTIDHDIQFLDSRTYANLNEIPKLVIYAQNININCSVSRIDAVLIADKNIETCYNSSDVNSRMNSNQLIINGSIISDTMSANRTYGAAKGANSMIPAEIVNYDATLYLWGANRASVAESGLLITTYQHELSPRV